MCTNSCLVTHCRSIIPECNVCNFFCAFVFAICSSGCDFSTSALFSVAEPIEVSNETEKNCTGELSYSMVFLNLISVWQVPIHTVAMENDQVLRGWLNCPELQKRLTAFYESEKFQKKEVESAELRKELEGILGIEKIELKDFYNV